MIFLELTLWRKIKEKKILIIPFLIIILALFVEQVSFNLRSYDKLAYRDRLDELSSIVDNEECHLSYYAFSKDKNPTVEEVLMMWAGLKSSQKVINGYSGNRPLQYKPQEEAMTLEEVKDWLKENGERENNLCYIINKSDKIIQLSENKTKKIFESNNYILYKVK
jgi:hypothetical protein